MESCATGSSRQLRPGRLRDLKAVLSLERTVFGRHALEPASMLWLLARRWPGLIVAEESGRPIGHVITRVSGWWWNKRGGISSIAVDPAYLRQGVGRRLMQAALEFLERAGVEVVDLEVSVGNRPAISLYESLGFIARRRMPDYYGLGEDGIRMTLVK